MSGGRAQTTVIDLRCDEPRRCYSHSEILREQTSERQNVNNDREYYRALGRNPVGILETSSMFGS